MRCAPRERRKCPAMRWGWPYSARSENSTRWPTSGSPRSTADSRRPRISSARSRRCASTGSLRSRHRAERARSVDLLCPVADDATCDTHPAFGAPLGVDHRALALHDLEIAAEVVGDAHCGGAGGLILRYAEVVGEHPGADFSRGL